MDDICSLCCGSGDSLSDHCVFLFSKLLWSCEVTSLHFVFLQVFRIPRSKGPLVWNPLNLDHSHSSVQQTKVHKMGALSGNSCFHFVLLCLAWRLHKVHFTFHWKDIMLLKLSSSPPSTGLHLFINRQSMSGKIGRDNDSFLIRKSLLLLSCTARLLRTESRHTVKDY